MSPNAEWTIEEESLGPLIKLFNENRILDFSNAEGTSGSAPLSIVNLPYFDRAPWLSRRAHTLCLKVEEAQRSAVSRVGVSFDVVMYGTPRLSERHR